MSARILVVDDEPTVARAIATSFRFRGHDVTICHSYEDAVAELRQRSYQLAIVDYVLPVISGVSLSLYIREFHPAMGVILISGMPDKRLFTHGFGSADRFVPKGNSFQPLVDAAEQVLAQRPRPATILR